MPHFVPLSRATPQPWRNGGGVTRELLAWPHAGGGTSDHWTVRVSVADITQDGPFSAFPGIDRCFAVLEGAGVELILEERPIRLSPGDPPVQFDGAAAPGCRLLDGSTRDLNLMVRRAAGRARMAQALRGAPWTGAEGWRAAYVHGPATVDFGAGPQTLAAAGLAWTSDAWASHPASGRDASAAAWTLIDGGPAWWLWMDGTELST